MARSSSLVNKLCVRAGLVFAPNRNIHHAVVGYEALGKQFGKGLTLGYSQEWAEWRCAQFVSISYMTNLTQPGDMRPDYPM